MDDEKEIKKHYKGCNIKITTWYVRTYDKWRAHIYIHYPSQPNSEQIHDRHIEKLFNTRKDAELFCLSYYKTKIDSQFG